MKHEEKSDITMEKYLHGSYVGHWLFFNCLLKAQ
jgi:hypothetical protein